MSKIGYIRQLPKSESIDLQLLKLRSYGCNCIFIESEDRNIGELDELSNCLNFLKKGDTLVVNNLQHLGKTPKEFVLFSQWLLMKNIKLDIVDMKISTSDEKTKDMFYSILYAINENESIIASERTKIGLKTARSRGRNGGRPSISNEIKKQIKNLYREKKLTVAEIAKKVGVSTTTVYRTLK
ncbi:recombinase family protein [Staphylococcus epidermidis]|nr:MULTISPECIES: recombinase family protein [Staphylococcus]MCG2371917.1 recombinase family protein [Staphylococcus epidermidis]MCK6108329.1 recombinase family protein [Staphylococcus epidermidis]MDL9974963.1 recombinase family protein [Staphylococcus aureus]HCX9496701.1 recombinase family protein [Staphylococcus aureus]HDG3442616.1 recombinase family protein [Staphylococcus aureus]